MKGRSNKIFTNLLIVLAGSYFLFVYSQNVFRDYYFLFHKSKTTADVIKIENDKVKPPILTISYFNANTQKIETCNFKADLHFGHKVQKDSIKKTDIYYTTYDPCDIYIIEYKSPTIVIIIFRVIILIVISWTILFYLTRLFKNITEKDNAHPDNET